MSREQRQRERDKFTDPESEKKWGLGMAVVFVLAVLAAPVFRLLGLS